MMSGAVMEARSRWLRLQHGNSVGRAVFSSKGQACRGFCRTKICPTRNAGRRMGCRRCWTRQDSLFKSTGQQDSVCQSLKLPVVSNCDLPLVISFYWSHDIVSEHSAVGLLLWLARRSGTQWQMNCKLTLVIGLNQLWRLSSLPLTSLFSALEASVVMLYINWWLTLTLTLTFLVFMVILMEWFWHWLL